MSVFNTLKRSHGGIIVEDYETRPKIVVDLDLEDSITPELLISPKFSVIVIFNQFLIKKNL
jgi:hypothetical protein